MFSERVKEIWGINREMGGRDRQRTREEPTKKDNERKTFGRHC